MLNVSLLAGNRGREQVGDLIRSLSPWRSEVTRVSWKPVPRLRLEAEIRTSSFPVGWKLFPLLNSKTSRLVAQEMFALYLGWEPGPLEFSTA